jgi:hypothetical protein
MRDNEGFNILHNGVHRTFRDRKDFALEAALVKLEQEVIPMKARRAVCSEVKGYSLKTVVAQKQLAGLGIFSSKTGRAYWPNLVRVASLSIDSETL